MIDKEKVKQLLKAYQSSLPAQSLFWEIDIWKEKEVRRKNISLIHGTNDYTIHTFYKAISIHINLNKYE